MKKGPLTNARFRSHRLPLPRHLERAQRPRPPQRRERRCAEDGRYIDPLIDQVQGYEAIDDTIAAAQARFPDFVFRLAGPVDGHHDFCRFGWELGPEGAEAPIAGFDVAVVGPDGELQRVVGFLDRVPAAPAA